MRLAKFGVELRLREQVQELLDEARRFEHVFVDLEGIDQVGDAFLDELIHVWPDRAWHAPLLINANDRIARHIAAVRNRQDGTA